MATIFSPPISRAYGDRALLLEFGDAIDPDVNRAVGRALAALLKQRPPWLEEAIPAYRSLLVIFNPGLIDHEGVRGQVAALDLARAGSGLDEAEVVEIPVCYGGEFGPDLEFVAEHNQLSLERVIELHCAAPYHIYMMGFTPGFPYLGGLDPRLHTPRLESPRTMVAAGSVGIANAQTGVYPIASPGGWRLIGRTPLKLFDPDRQDPFLLRAGAKLRFRPISLAQYHDLAEGD